MLDYTLRIPENSPRAKALLDYLRSLDFAEVIATKDWYDELSFENKESIQRGLNDLENGNVHSDSDVRNSIRERILKARK